MPDSLPSFEKLQVAYPQDEWDDVLDRIFKPNDMKWLGNNTCTTRLSHNTVHLGVQKPHITGRVFWDRQRWRVFLLAFRPAFVSATTSALA